MGFEEKETKFETTQRKYPRKSCDNVKNDIMYMHEIQQQPQNQHLIALESKKKLKLEKKKHLTCPMNA